MNDQQYESKSIMEMARGAILERVDFEMERVLKISRMPTPALRPSGS